MIFLPLSNDNGPDRLVGLGTPSVWAGTDDDTLLRAGWTNVALSLRDRKADGGMIAQRGETLAGVILFGIPVAERQGYFEDASAIGGVCLKYRLAMGGRGNVSY